MQVYLFNVSLGRTQEENAAMNHCALCDDEVLYTSICMHTSLSVSVGEYIYLCIYIHIYIYVHVCIYIYIFTYI